MRFVWAWGALTAWLFVPCAMALANDGAAAGVFVIPLFIGASGVLASYWALCTLIYRMLKAGDVAEAEEEEREIAAKAAKRLSQEAAVEGA